jgi:hypothetical protein
MLRAKRRRTQTHNKVGNPIPNTMNSTPLQSKYVNKNMHQKQLQKCKCFCGNSGCNCPLKHSAVEIKEMGDHLKKVIGVPDYINIAFETCSFPDCAQPSASLKTALTGQYKRSPGTTLHAGKWTKVGGIETWQSEVYTPDGTGDPVWKWSNGTIVPTPYVAYCGVYQSYVCSSILKIQQLLYTELASGDVIEAYKVKVTPTTHINNLVEVMEARRCNTKISRNPILGYRKVLHFPTDCPNPNELKSVPTNIVYKDNYAKTCGAFRNEIVTVLKANGEIESNTKLCGYSQTKPHIQNRNGWKNDKYNYSSKQYLERRCRTFKDQEFNFLSNIPLKGSSKTEFPTCDQFGCGTTEKICAKKGYTKCEATNNNCKAVYKRSNPRFSTQGAVSSGSRLNRLKYQTQLKAQSTGYVVSGKNNQNKTSMTNNSTSSTSFGIDPFINSVNGFGNAVNGAYPVSLYRSTYPTYKANLGGLCIGKGQTRNGIPQSCKMSGDCSRTPCNKVNGLN